MPHEKASLFVTYLAALTLTSGTLAPMIATGEVYRIELKNRANKVVASRLLNTEESSGQASHVHGGMAVEVNDNEASCGVFIQPQARETTVRAADVMVSLIRNSGPIETRMVSSNSALLAKQKTAESDKDVFPKSSSQRSVSVNAKKLDRSCTVSVL